MQGLFRNPLADPGLVGVSAGASLGAVLVIVLGATAAGGGRPLARHFALPLAAFVGGLATTLIALPHRDAAAAAPRSRRMLLAGIALARDGAAP